MISKKKGPTTLIDLTLKLNPKTSIILASVRSDIRNRETGWPTLFI
jgi:hypothetical protein